MSIIQKLRTAVSRTVECLVRRSSVFRDTEHKLYLAQAHVARVDEENRELDERIVAIARRLCSVEVQRPPDPMRRRLCVCVEIETMILECGFLHGDNATIIDHIGRDIGARAAHEIHRAGFSRWDT